MTWSAEQRRQRERAWRPVERFAAELPPELFERFTLLEFDLAIRHAPSGQFRDAFTGAAQFPLLSVGSWLIRDLSRAPGPPSPAVEERLLLASALLGVRDHAVERGSGGPFATAADLALIDVLDERAASELARVPRAGSTSVDRARVLREGLERSLARRASWGWLDPPTDPARYLLPRWSAPARAVARAALAFARRDDITAEVDSLLDHVAAAFEILGDLSSVHSDLLAGRITFPIATVARAAGLPLRPPLDPTVALGALVLTGSIGTIRAAAVERLRSGHAIAEGLGLGSFASFLSDAEAGLSGAAAGGPATPAPAAPILVERDDASQALEMAAGYLLADPLLAESWETHREGMFGAPVVVSRFPAGLILEILRHRGHDVGAGVEAFIDRTVADGFRYYDHPLSGIDADTLGVVLRLLPDPAGQGRWRDAIDAKLDALDRAVEIHGEIPVWIPDPAATGADRPPTFDLGDHCGTVACHLLLGLMEYAPAGHARTISTGLAALLARIGDVGLAANVNYTPAFALAAFARLLRCIDRPTFRSALPDRPLRAAVAAAGESLASELDRLLAPQVATPQQAALYTVACHELGMLDRIDPRWRAMLLASQRWDGSWPGESFAVVPTRGRTVAWFTCAPLTTALCYDALARG